MLFVLLFIFFQTFQLTLSHSYCIDRLCPYKCCMDYYTCAISEDCQKPKSYIWPFLNGESCSSNSDCASDCCMSGSCDSRSNCTSKVGIIVGICCGIFILIVIIVFCAYRYKKNHKISYNVVNQNISNESTIDKDFDKGNFKEKLDVIKNTNILGGMPFKPKGKNIIYTDFKISTI